MKKSVLNHWEAAVHVSICYQVLVLNILYIVKRYDRETSGTASQFKDNNRVSSSINISTSRFTSRNFQEASTVLLGPRTVFKI